MTNTITFGDSIVYTRIPTSPRNRNSAALRAVVFALGWLAAAASALSQPRGWVADQGNNQVSGNPNNRILEIDPIHHKDPPDSQGDAIILNTVPSPAGAFLDELTFDDQRRLWCVVKDDGDQDPDGARRIDPNTGHIQATIRPTFPGEASGGFLEGLAWDGTGLWVSAVRIGLTGNMLTRVDPATGSPIPPFDAGPGFVNIPGQVAQGLLYDPRGSGFLWHSDVQEQRIYKLDINKGFSVVKQFNVPFGPKGMDFMGERIWVASPHNGIWELDPAAPDGSDGQAVKLFNTPLWNLDGLAILPEPPGPKITVSPTTMTPTVWIGGTLPDDTFTVANGGTGGTLTYEITWETADGSAWMSVDPVSGESTGEADAVTVAYHGTETLRAGAHHATITVSGNAWNSPQRIAVTLTVQTVGPDLDGDADVDMSDFGRFQACLTAPGGPITLPDCEAADLDADNDVDAADFARFSACMSGAGAAALPGCDQ